MNTAIIWCHRHIVRHMFLGTLTMAFWWQDGFKRSLLHFIFCHRLIENHRIFIPWDWYKNVDILNKYVNAIIGLSPLFLCNLYIQCFAMNEINLFTPTGLYGIFQIKTWTIPFQLLRVERVKLFFQIFLHFNYTVSPSCLSKKSFLWYNTYLYLHFHRWTDAAYGSLRFHSNMLTLQLDYVLSILIIIFP